MKEIDNHIHQPSPKPVRLDCLREKKLLSSGSNIRGVFFFFSESHEFRTFQPLTSDCQGSPMTWPGIARNECPDVSFRLSPIQYTIPQVGQSHTSTISASLGMALIFAKRPGSRGLFKSRSWPGFIKPMWE